MEGGLKNAGGLGPKAPEKPPAAGYNIGTDRRINDK